jgi:branched-chain amino acid transport system ATP-binding protein
VSALAFEAHASPVVGPGPRSAPPLLRAEGVCKRYAGIVALSDVSIAVERGSFVGLLGPNGAGKTTLFDCLTGRQQPDEGEVELDGQDLTSLRTHQRAQLGIARTFQRMELFAGMTVREHLTVAHRARTARTASRSWRELIGWVRPASDEGDQCDEVLSLLGLRGDADRPIEALTLGQGRMVELGRALMTAPKLLFLDEPSSGLDRQETADMGDVLRQVQRDANMTVLLVEHDIPMVQQLTTDLFVLDAGALIASGPTGEVLADPAVRAAYLGLGA